MYYFIIRLFPSSTEQSPAHLNGHMDTNSPVICGDNGKLPLKWIATINQFLNV